MRYRKLGRTGAEVGIIGLGAEYLEFVSRETVVSVVDEAVARGVNYIDLFMSSPDVRDNFGIALQNRRHRVMIAGHLGAALKHGQYCRSRDKTVSTEFFTDLLTRLQTDYIDVLMLHFLDEPDDYKVVFGSGGLLDLALKLKKEGKARLIGMSGHRVPVALDAVNSGRIDVLMFPVNPAFDALPGELTLEAAKQGVTRDRLGPTRKELYQACAVRGVGLVAMKPYGGGVLFSSANPSSIVLTPVQCLNYALSQPGVSTVIPGCKNAAEMKAALAFLEASDEEKDYSAISDSSLWKLKGNCVYCNHCLPCPVGIDIGMTIRLADTAGYRLDEAAVAYYEALPVKASECNECGECVERCPFGVDIIASMNRAVAVFGK